jgi:hypothetical protein
MNGAMAAPDAATDADGKKVNGFADPEDNDRWVERTGWAPRFGNPADDEESPLDHQTWVEQRLDEKFFGGEDPRRNASYLLTD